MAAGPVVPVNCVLFVKVHCCSEVEDGFVKLEEPVPYESPSVVGWGVALINGNDLVEIFQGELETVATYFLSYRSQVVHSLNVAGLEPNCTDIIVFCLL